MLNNYSQCTVLIEAGQYQKISSAFAQSSDSREPDDLTFWDLLAKAVQQNSSVGLKHPFQRRRFLRLGERLQAAGLIKIEQVGQILAYQRQHPNLRFGEIAVMWGWLERETVNSFVRKN
ncbi:hypothetical protein [Oscillatoria sp. FACHB-1406]|uniref:hypothetical protein n=1 Tax=Oscillatoria sp. FACHB-1406 TaxID=2692846 RepID=UPI00168931C6|nr:hypothetical protein [Oscillatoria sp. FACHB-1406]MBD2580543.1 hypothetical protein [Oscillatoria sp. FACHB-1406]